MAVIGYCWFNTNIYIYLMKSNHPFKHEEEVEPEGSGYKNWSLKINELAPVVVNSEDVFKMLSGSGIGFDFDPETKSLTVTGQALLFKKPNKPVDGASYTIKAEDATKWLVVNQNCTITVPKGLSIHDIFEGEANAGATVTFQQATGATINHVASIGKVLSPHGVFGVRVKATDKYTLYGTDPINYNP